MRNSTLNRQAVLRDSSTGMAVKSRLKAGLKIEMDYPDPPPPPKK